MTDNFLAEFLAEDESFPGYTDAGANANHQALIKAQLKPDADWDGRILSEVTTFMYDLHSNPVLHAGDIERRLKVFETKLDAVAPHSGLA